MKEAQELALIVLTYAGSIMLITMSGAMYLAALSEYVEARYYNEMRKKVVNNEPTPV